ncbi:insecticidal toxin complex protein TccB [Xenorhabdus sp. XENO-7]|uniref:Insecticidal toxin complex protein TccB n=1 Tax=Xenorhabdus aichiensis TaxID=3025874 RepID=A0ABT5M2A5_9GAMM|nr:insecticidal toxin complex protein TccB [Xenorhabdus aichiensis]MDC9621817.1 insecticidal toxin complex protein TccB [Xenorhabdus aichiensis]
MLSTMEKQLNESQRDALVTGYMNFVAPTLKGVNGQPVTVEDLYEYLLIDPEVADEVETSRVAQAIASIQQYMTRLVNGSEPGRQAIEPSTANEWRDNDNQYAIWAAGAEVQNYAENYISPITRQEKSHYFSELETTLNQNQLDPDRVQDAALAYLNEFEAVSNLYVLSGYINQDKFDQAIYYFIGRTTTKPYRYYWRQMDLSKNRQDHAGNPVTPNCWNDWQEITLPLSGDTVLEHTVRPVFYNDRLYVAWVERDPAVQKDTAGKNIGNTHAYSIKFGYKRYDDTWTAPNTTTLMTQQAGESSETLRSSLLVDESSITLQQVNLLATTDFSIDPTDKTDSNPYGRLMLGVFVRNFTGNPYQNRPTVYGYLYCDSAFNSHTLKSLSKNFLFGTYRDEANDQNCLQFAVYDKKYVITKVEPGKPTEDSEGTVWANKIDDLKQGTTGAYVYIDDDGLTLHIQTTTNGDFVNRHTFGYADRESDSKSGYGFSWSGDEGFYLDYHDGNYYTFHNAMIAYFPAGYGGGSVPNGTWALEQRCDEGWAITPLLQPETLHTVTVKGGYIAWEGTTPTSVNLYIPDGTVLLDWCDKINFAIGLNKLESVFTSPDWPTLTTIKNFSKIADNRKFYQEINAKKADGADLSGDIDESKKTFQLASGAAYSKTYTLSEADFSIDPNKNYLQVCLSVMWDHYDRPSGKQRGSSKVSKWFNVYVALQDSKAPETSPQLKSRYDSKRGLVQYLDFNNNNLPAKTRLNTTFVRTLIEKANLGLDILLDYTLQANSSLEADLVTDGKGEPMDFNGSNGLYFWELFFHLPFLVASRFASEQQLSLAQKWLHYIFDPAMKNKPNNAPAYWNVRPLVEGHSDLSRHLGDPIDPDTQAYAHPVIYQKAVFIAYVSNLIAQGDMWYRQLTRDGLTQARVYYNLAAELLGSRPDVSLSSTWTPQTLDTLATGRKTALRDFEHQLGNSNTALPALPGRNVSYLKLADNGYFNEPLNVLMLSHWDTLDARLYNLRHNLTVDGKPLSLPLYAAPADPVALLAQRAQSGTLASGVSGAMLTVPPYRFSAVLPRAYSAVGTLTSFGQNLLSLLERSERAGQEELAQQQLLDMSSYAITLQQQALDGLAADRLALLASQATAQQRHDHYYTLYQNNISSAEQLVMDTQTSAQSLIASSTGVQTASGALKVLPNIFGLADGGMRYEGVTEAVAIGLMTAGQATSVVAERLATTENYRRRREEWQIQYQQAQSEVEALTKQLDALVVREKAAQTSLQQAKAQQAQIRTMLTYLTTRFTQATLYQWLSGQLAALYYQAYDAVVSLCLSAQACWQYELGDYAATFIQTGTWNDHYRGLQVGETLQLNLHQMEAAYLARHERRLNVIRTVSLKTLLGDSAFGKLKTEGKVDFTLSEKLFDNDYPGHYLRQIKTVSVTLPTLIGPYQNVKATLTQTSSSTLLSADINGVKYLNDPTDKAGDTSHIVTNLRASQQVALSSGMNDTGSFELRLDDERYLSFEGTGAVSKWTLSFPRAVDKKVEAKTLAADPMQALLLANLNDVLVQVHYTACDGGASFANAVEATLAG